MSAIDYDNGWPAFDGCMPFWQPSCITNFCLVIVFILLWKINFLSSLSLSVFVFVLKKVFFVYISGFSCCQTQEKTATDLQPNSFLRTHHLAKFKTLYTRFSDQLIQ